MSKRINSMMFGFEMCKHEPVNSYPKRISFGAWNLCCDPNTPVSKASHGNRELMVFGLAVDVRDISVEDLPGAILENTETLNDVIQYEYYLGGKYLLFYREDDQIFAIPDATGSIPLYYSLQGDEMHCSSFLQSIVQTQKLIPDARLSRIRKKSDISQAMPYDYTCYKEIKQLLPNHVLFFQQQRAYRFINAAENQRELTAQQAVETTTPYICNLLDFYQSKYKIYCPITAGRDSRVVLAFLRARYRGELHGYTIRHSSHSGLEDDLLIPRKIAESCGFQYEQILDETPSVEVKSELDFMLGAGMYSPRTLMIANTIYNHYYDGAIINGDIIGQVGKCSLHRDIPEFLATPGYFRCKLHNYSKESRDALAEWLSEIDASGECLNRFDLFSIENRMGRWAAQENTVYNLIGQRYFNIFNSRCIIYQWSRVNRKDRKKADLHKLFIRDNDIDLLNIPFEQEKNFFIKLSRANGLTFYCASYIKHFAERIAFSRRYVKEEKSEKTHSNS